MSCKAETVSLIMLIVVIIVLSIETYEISTERGYHMPSFPQTCPLFEGLKYMPRRGFFKYILNIQVFCQQY